MLCPATSQHAADDDNWLAAIHQSLLESEASVVSKRGQRSVRVCMYVCVCVHVCGHARVCGFAEFMKILLDKNAQLSKCCHL